MGNLYYYNISGSELNFILKNEVPLLHKLKQLCIIFLVL